MSKTKHRGVYNSFDANQKKKRNWSDGNIQKENPLIV